MLRGRNPGHQQQAQVQHADLHAILVLTYMSCEMRCEYTPNKEIHIEERQYVVNVHNIPPE